MALVLNGDGKISGANLNIDSDGAATFTGLTVDTSTLHVDAVNNRVGIGTSSPTARLEVGDLSAPAIIDVGGGDTLQVGLNFNNANAAKPQIWAEYVDNGSWGIRYRVAGDTGTAATRMRIDNAGRVTVPYQPSFFCSQSAGDTITGSNQVVDGWTVQHNTGSHFDASTERFTAPIAGVYHFSFCIEIVDNFSNSTFAYIAKNGGQISTARIIAQPGTYRHSLTGAWTVLLSANDYITVNAGVSSGSTILDNSGFFCGHLLG